MTYNADAGLYTNTFPLERKPDCPVCGSELRRMTVSPEITLQGFFDILRDVENLYAGCFYICTCRRWKMVTDSPTLTYRRLNAPSATVGGRSLYLRAPPALEEILRSNLDKKS